MLCRRATGPQAGRVGFEPTTFWLIAITEALGARPQVSKKGERRGDDRVVPVSRVTERPGARPRHWITSSREKWSAQVDSNHRSPPSEGGGDGQAPPRAAALSQLEMVRAGGFEPPVSSFQGRQGRPGSPMPCSLEKCGRLRVKPPLRLPAVRR